jgi:hypothetical protein
MKKIFIITLMLSLPCSAFADTHVANSCSLTHVQAAVAAATDGDVVAIPVGSCTWTAPLILGTKNLTIKGEGIDRTVITANIGTAFGNDTFYIEASGKTFRITGMTLTDSGTTGGAGTGSLSPMGHVYIRGDHNTFSIDHMKVSEPSYRSVSIGGYRS